MNSSKLLKRSGRFLSLLTALLLSCAPTSLAMSLDLPVNLYGKWYVTGRDPVPDVDPADTPATYEYDEGSWEIDIQADGKAVIHNAHQDIDGHWEWDESAQTLWVYFYGKGDYPADEPQYGMSYALTLNEAGHLVELFDGTRLENAKPQKFDPPKIPQLGQSAPLKAFDGDWKITAGSATIDGMTLTLTMEMIAAFAQGLTGTDVPGDVVLHFRNGAIVGTNGQYAKSRAEVLRLHYNGYALVFWNSPSAVAIYKAGPDQMIMVPTPNDAGVVIELTRQKKK